MSRAVNARSVHIKSVVAHKSAKRDLDLTQKYFFIVIFRLILPRRTIMAKF